MTRRHVAAQQRESDDDYAQTHEDTARVIARQFNRGSTVRIDRVIPRPKGASFNVIGAMGEAVASFDVVITEGTPREIWSLWCLVFGIAGLRVKEDLAYLARASAEDDRAQRTNARSRRKALKRRARR